MCVRLFNVVIISSMKLRQFYKKKYLKTKCRLSVQIYTTGTVYSHYHKYPVSVLRYIRLFS